MKIYFELYKIINVLLLVVVSMVWLYTIYYYRSGLCSANCTFELMSGILDPIKAATLYLIPSLVLFTMLPSDYFRRWLWYIASWALPASLYVVLSESIYTTALFSGRTFFASFTMQLLFIISVLFVLVHYSYDRYRARLKTRP